MNLVGTKIISNISNLTNIEKEFIADRYDAILFNNGDKP